MTLHNYSVTMHSYSVALHRRCVTFHGHSVFNSTKGHFSAVSVDLSFVASKMNAGFLCNCFVIGIPVYFLCFARFILNRVTISYLFTMTY